MWISVEMRYQPERALKPSCPQYDSSTVIPVEMRYKPERALKRVHAVKLLELLLITTQAREGIETPILYRNMQHGISNNSSPLGHWNCVHARKLTFQNVTTQAREGIETQSSLLCISLALVTTQAREGIETPLQKNLKHHTLVTTQAREASSACPQQKTKT